MSTGVASEGVGQVQAGLAALNATDVAGLPDEQVRAEVLALVTCLNQLTGALLTRVGSFDLRDLSQLDAQRASSTWLVDFTRVSKGTALRWLIIARQLAKLPALAGRLRAGTVSLEQLLRIADLVRHIGIDRVREYDQILADLCADAGPVEVEKACARIWALVDPDGAELDPDEDFDRREITFSRLGAMMYIRGRLDPEGAATLQTAVDALMRPPGPGDERSAGQRRADAVVDLARGVLAGGAVPDVGGERPHVGILVTPEILFGTPNPAPARCPHTTSGNGSPDAGTDGHDPTDNDATGSAVDTTETEVVADGTGSTAGSARRANWRGAPAASSGCDCDPLTLAGVPQSPQRPWLNWMGEVSPQLAQRLACDGIIWRLVLDPRTGLPLNVGRKVRIVPWWMRKAIRARDRTCRWPGCDVPSEWTDAHHLTFWWRGGVTSVEETISLCRYHHGLVHEGEWTLCMDHATGEVWVTRPDGSDYELGPSRPWTSPNHQGPRPQAPPTPAPAPRLTDPPWPEAA